jgi:ribA/ribD-fused uncharacterized protein
LEASVKLDAALHRSDVATAHEKPYGAFGQWYRSNFTARPYPSSSSSIEPIAYSCSEQFMMHSKALLFSSPDHPVAQAILSTSDPVEIKKLGAQVPNFDQEKWDEHKFGIVVEASYAKFSQDARLKALLLGTEDRLLAEASPFDQIWGIGCGEKRARQEWKEGKTSHWYENLLGKALMEARARLTSEAGLSDLKLEG